MKLLIATWNPSKLKMFQNLLKNFKWIEFFSLSDFPEVKEPIEDWKTTEENALIKAKYYCKKFNINVLADDAWLKIHDLDWKPWVMARRWWWELPATVSDDDFLEFLLKKIIHINKDKLPACFPFSRCLYLTTWNYFFQTERIDVFLSKIPRRPYKKWWPVSALKIFPDWRHNLDIPDDDPVLLEWFKKEWLFSLLNNLVN
jgi:inosine/xanthosine triphosphate pyrophosphatase family protein